MLINSIFCQDSITWKSVFTEKKASFKGNVHDIKLESKAWDQATNVHIKILTLLFGRIMSCFKQIVHSSLFFFSKEHWFLYYNEEHSKMYFCMNAFLFSLFFLLID